MISMRRSFPRTSLTRLLSVQYPIVQAPMSPITPASLVAAVSEAGGLGSLAAARLSPESILSEAATIRRLTSRPFAVNLFVPKSIPPYSPADVQRVRTVLQRVHRTLSEEAELPTSIPLPPPPPPPYSAEDFDASVAAFERQVEAVFASSAPVFSFTFGLPHHTLLREARRRGVITLGTATTPQEAHTIARTGLVDAIVVQGAEAGGHRGSFLTEDTVTAHRAAIGLFSLLPLCRAVVPPELPLIAAGGVMDGRGLAAALTLGGDGVVMGTRFMTAKESTLIPAEHSRQLLMAEGIRRATEVGKGQEAEERELLAQEYRPTVLTRAFSGRPARGFYNEMVAAFNEEEGEAPPLPWAVQATQAQPYEAQNLHHPPPPPSAPPTLHSFKLTLCPCNALLSFALLCVPLC